MDSEVGDKIQKIIRFSVFQTPRRFEMTIEHLVSEKIAVGRSEARRIDVIDGATHFRISRRVLAQFQVNSVPAKKMREILPGAVVIEIEYERHRYCNCYTFRLLDKGGNNLKTYNL